MEKELDKRLKGLKKQITQLEKQLQIQQEVLMTRSQAAIFLSVSLTTLRTWTESGTLIGKRLGGRIYYLKSEIIGSMNRIQQ